VNCIEQLGNLSPRVIQILRLQLLFVTVQCRVPPAPDVLHRIRDPFERIITQRTGSVKGDVMMPAHGAPDAVARGSEHCRGGAEPGLVHVGERTRYA
jgi:hypothetical protein